MDLQHLTPEAIARLSEEQALEVLDALEVLHRGKRRDSMVEYAAYIEVPGTPTPLTENDRIAMLKRKEAMRKGDIDDIELPPDEPEEEWYPRQLKIFPHHALILNSVQAMVEEDVVVGPLANGHVGIVPDGVMLFLPPGSAKSSFGSVVVPTYCMGKWPGFDVIGLSYAAQLAQKFGRRARQICRSAAFQDTWEYRGEPVTVSGDNSAVDQWSLTNGSTFRAVGILGGVTGNRADLGIIDDPIAGREEASSEIVREKVFEAFNDDVATRLKPRGKLLYIGTRWHEDDPAGRILGENWEGESGLWKGTDGRWWLVLCCPYLADREDDPLGREIGERLWPEWFDDRHEELARGAGDRAWQSLYQQKPAASDGVILLKSYWKCWPHGKPEPEEQQIEHPEEVEPPRNWTQTVLVYDTAIEADQDNDYSAMSAWAAFGRAPTQSRKQRLGKDGADDQQNLILLGGDRAKLQAVDLFKWVAKHVEFFKPDWILVEKRASGHQLLQELRRTRMRYEDLGQMHYPQIVDWLPPFPPKAQGMVPRAHSAAVLLERGTVWYMPGPTSERIIKECAAVPNGRNDDWAATVTMMLIWSRDINLLEVPEDVMDEKEEETREREDRQLWDEPRALYGRSPTRKERAPSTAARALYGRSPKSTKHWDED